MAKDFNQPQVVENYDQHIRKLIPGYALVHQQIQVILQLLNKPNAQVLIVGCGTGCELILLAQYFPYYKFTAIDIAPNMLEKAKMNVHQHHLSHQIDFIEGDTSVLQQLHTKYDVALSVLVAHFVAKDKKSDFFTDIYSCLKPDGICINVDLMDFKHQNEMSRLIQLAEHTGLHPKQTQLMSRTFENDFSLISADKMQEIYQNIGFQSSEIFFQIFNYYGFIAYKGQ